MFSRSTMSLLGLLVATMLGLVLVAPAQAATYTWDVATLDSAITDGTGTWQVGAGNWYNATTFTYDQNWADSSDAVFGTGTDGAAGAVAISGTVQPNKITFNAANGGGNYSVTGVAGTNYLTFASTTSTLTVDVPTSGVTGTISADIGSTTTWTNASNVIAKTGAGNLILSGICYLFDERNGNGAAGFTVDGGGTLEITGFLKAASSNQSNRGNFTSTIGANSANNTLKLISGGPVYTDVNGLLYGSLMSGGMIIGGGTFGGNMVILDRPGDLSISLGYTWRIQGNGAQVNIGGSSSNNSLTIQNGAYLRQTGGGGTNAWGIGGTSTATNNQILITGTDGAGHPSTLDRDGSAGSAIYVGGGDWNGTKPTTGGSNNSIVVSAGGLLRPHRLVVGGGTTATGNFVQITGSGSKMDTSGNTARNWFAVGTASGATGNYFLVEQQGRADVLCTGAGNPNDVGEVAGADNNYIRVKDTGSVMNFSWPSPLAVGGKGQNVNTDGGDGNHLDVWDGGLFDMVSVGSYHPSLYALGTNTAINLGNGAALAELRVGGSAIPGVYLKNASGSLNFNNGRLTASVAGALVSGAGQVNLNGPAYFSTAYTNSIDNVIADPLVSGGTLYKEGAGTLTLTQVNTYGGPTVVNGGTLQIDTGTANTGTINNTSGITVKDGARFLYNNSTIALTQPITVESGGTLGGTGNIDVATTIGGGARISPGASVGELKFDTKNMKWENGGRYVWE
ncbi:MAG: autotransporter-associated beta strand repeat-containing protein, partial [Planctomycetota bacterium]|nr:autotransporter-associated beta strand repeat-containing protein [Planctomycetota bacterium]